MDLKRGALALAGVGLLVMIIARLAWSPPEAPAGRGAQVIWDFEPGSLERFEVARPGVQITARREGERWVLHELPWRPSPILVRRVQHQLQKLPASTRVPGAELGLYGLGGEGAQLRLWLEGGKQLGLEVGAVHPTGGSRYVRVIPDGRDVFVVKRAAVDYAWDPPEAYFDRRFARFDVERASRLELEVGGERRILRRREAGWEQVEPEPMELPREGMRRLLGWISALQAEAFVMPEGEGSGKLERPVARIAVRGEGMEPVTLTVGPLISTGTRQVLREEDGAVFEVGAQTMAPLWMPNEAWLEPGGPATR